MFLKLQSLYANFCGYNVTLKIVMENQLLISIQKKIVSIRESGHKPTL